ncbi:MAG TPA: hypothetical protein VKV37_09810 [Ktedonobacteraceae bacterium]|nr:hypothetical protein [Ktedonobacteraceae bacterium]
MGKDPARKGLSRILAAACICCLLYLSACQGDSAIAGPKPTPPATRGAAPATATGTPQTGGAISMQVPGQHATPTPKPKGKAKPAPGATATLPAVAGNSNRPLLAFYYMWYNTSTWSLSTMSDLPTIKYNSSDTATIDRQLGWAANAGITGFISSWWGPGDQTDSNFAKLLSRSAALQQRTGYNFASSIYFESDAPALQGEGNIVKGLLYLKSHYGNNPHFFHWQGKPVIFFWDPLGGGRSLTEWAAIRSQVDPNDQMIWSAEGVNLDMLSVFDGIHLFSAGYWGLNNNDMAAVDEGFRNEINAYNSAHGTHKIWAAGVMPGYNDTRVPGRTGTFIVPRNNGATYQESWQGALASSPDWVTITSFNEWFEGAMIEPSVTYGSLYLNLTQRFAYQWEG